ncbi:hypothetical protein NQ317_005083 [Molorchus minor]|uniref:Sodefrin-like factor n=1 Tax=Molorchus minor TaxID=1323400 RepID=A0ABQ9JWA0_9CUCU|nr:hypothetical protein NQ317_005083 [Molorchus minor]
MKIVLCLLTILFVSKLQKGVAQLTCYDCQGGPMSKCGQVVAMGDVIPCTGKNAQCYEAYIDYQKGAMPMVQRRCWTTPNNSNARDFCRWFSNPVGELRSCKSCTTSYCNTDNRHELIVGPFEMGGLRRSIPRSFLIQEPIKS